MKKRKLQFDFWTVVTIGIIAVFALFDAAAVALFIARKKKT